MLKLLTIATLHTGGVTHISHQVLKPVNISHMQVLPLHSCCPTLYASFKGITQHQRSLCACLLDAHQARTWRAQLQSTSEGLSQTIPIWQGGRVCIGQVLHKPRASNNDALHHRVPLLRTYATHHVRD